MVSLLPTKFHEILFSSFRGVALSCFRKSITPTGDQNFLVICTTTYVEMPVGMLAVFEPLDRAQSKKNFEPSFVKIG